MMVDPDARYLKSHEWAKKLKDNAFSVGFSAYAVEQLGEIVNVKLPDLDIAIQKEDSFGIIESVKTSIEISTPLSGIIVEINTGVPDNPDILNRDAYGAGWLIKIEVTDMSEWDDLMDASVYRKFLETEG